MAARTTVLCYVGKRLMNIYTRLVSRFVVYICSLQKTEPVYWCIVWNADYSRGIKWILNYNRGLDCNLKILSFNCNFTLVSE